LPSGSIVDDRLRVDAKINGKPVKLALDTGSELPLLLFRESAEKLGLQITNHDATAKIPQGKVSVDWTEESELQVSGTTINATFGVLKVPAGIEFELDGLLGWPAVRKNIIHFDCANLRYEFLRRLPGDISSWTNYRLKDDVSVLAFDVSDTGTGNATVVIDTGFSGGICLSSNLWRQWTNTHANRQKTIHGDFTFGSGLQAREQSWTEALSLGRFSISNMPVWEANSSDPAGTGESFNAVLGIFALKCFDLIVDGEHGVIYFKANSSGPGPYRHNRLGAVFAPADLEKGNDLIAHVIKGSPAEQAGIRGGDILLKIDSLDATKWRTDAALKPMSQFWSKAPGTKMKLKLRRGDKEFETEVVLRDLIGPGVAPTK